MLKPFFAPGIIYNTIKSGVAIDYPIMTGSFNSTSSFISITNIGTRMHTSASFGIFSNSRQISQNPDSLTVSHNDGWDYRVPFEAIVEPSKYISGKNIKIFNLDGEEFKNKYGFRCPIGVQGRNSDNSLIREKLGWDYSQALNIGMKKTYNWIKDQLEE